MVKLPDYRLVEDYQNSSFAREAAERKKAAQTRAKKAWSKKYGADYAKRKGRNKVVTTKLKGPAMADGTYMKKKFTPNQGKVVTMADQTITAKGTKGLKGAGVSGTISPKPKNIYSPVYTGTPGVSQTYTGVNVTNPTTGVTKFTPSSEINKAIVKATKGKAAVKVVAKGASRLIPGIGTAMIAKDVYDVGKWAMSQPKKKKKDANIYGTVSSNKIYKGY